MSWSEVKQLYDAVREDRKTSKERWRKKAEKTAFHKSWLFKIFYYYFACEAFLALLVNYYLVDSLDVSYLDLSRAVVGAGFILVSMYLKWMVVYFFAGMIKLTFIALAGALTPVSMTLKYFLARQDGYQLPDDDVELFTEGAWMFSYMILLVCLFFLWFFPQTSLWPAEALGLNQNQYWGGSLYLFGLMACGALYFAFKGAMMAKTEPIIGPELLAWLRNPRSLEDLVGVPLVFGGLFLIFGYLVWPLLDLAIQLIKTLVATGFREALGYGDIMAAYPREQLLAILDQEKLGIMHGLVLPDTEGMERSFGFNLDHFRAVRDAALPHLLPVVLLMTAVLLWMRRRLSRETPAMPAPHAAPGMGE